MRISLEINRWSPYYLELNLWLSFQSMIYFNFSSYRIKFQYSYWMQFLTKIWKTLTAKLLFQPQICTGKNWGLWCCCIWWSECCCKHSLHIIWTENEILVRICIQKRGRRLLDECTIGISLSGLQGLEESHATREHGVFRLSEYRDDWWHCGQNVWPWSKVGALEAALQQYNRSEKN